MPATTGETVALPLQTEMPGTPAFIVAVSSGAMICRPVAFVQALWLLPTSEVTIRKLAS